MIHVSVLISKGFYKKMTVTGHAGSGDHGFDLVCAGVSSIMVGALNGFDSLTDSVELIMTQEPLIEIEIKHSNELNQKIFEFVLLQLKTIEQTQSKYIEINEKEVTS
ncbi:ribosomal-processing cysteine protease Prp [Erysipelothrix rhusiopathiae]|nr:ribosomal-processing cysteine protease Prp [Erysipelothrix rhusiopathiae]MDE8035958.1 ribosomal-processing cysteine protease Prp [Erysipelothrix rhusiopathiae]MDE8054660.1 ribosomal-processing cysteine protease Prp [Erysipelothrix rhusiopathiae]MDE8056349.1 ribosomal-processing cysteine protease Prp [Erysipelothrix rhusiopathiae]MDE8062834.1 ribosomal-processing cysteine protease Prp [Erysipelothrix rhusiopathiae]